METLKEMAEKIQAERLKAQQEALIAVVERVSVACNNVKVEFEARFKNLLPALKAEGIKYSVRMKDEHWDHKGYYILFKKNNKTCKMDFTNGTSFRLEYTEPGQHGRMVYGNWSDEDFILYLYNNLY